MTEAAEFSLDLRVYIEDTDAGGIVYYVNYLKFMERGRTEYMRALGYGKAAMFSDELMFVVRDVQVTYQRPARLDDELVVTAQVSELRGAVMVFRQSVRCGDEVLAEGDITIACVDKSGVKPRRLPKELQQQVRNYAPQPME